MVLIDVATCAPLLAKSRQAVHLGDRLGNCAPGGRLQHAARSWVCLGQAQDMVAVPLIVKAGDTLLFDTTALHGIEVIHSGLVSYLSAIYTLRE